MSKRIHRRATLYCSFCGISQHETDQLIAGPGVHICDQCVASASQIITERRIERGVRASLVGAPPAVDK